MAFVDCGLPGGLFSFEFSPYCQNLLKAYFFKNLDVRKCHYCEIYHIHPILQFEILD